MASPNLECGGFFLFQIVMTDNLTPERRSVNMSLIRSRDTTPEIKVRRLIHGLGYRYRLHRKDLPGKPDLVFGPKRKVIFVNGCFWHQHGDPSCTNNQKPKSNTSYWNEKLHRNVERDAENQTRLREMGWDIMVIWECDLKDLKTVKSRAIRFLNHSAKTALITNRGSHKFS